MPDRLALVKGPPAARRAHLDRFARRCGRRAPSPGGATAGRSPSATRCSAGSAPGSAGEASLDAWDAELAAAGVELIERAARGGRSARRRYSDGRRRRSASRARPRCATARAPRPPAPRSWRAELRERREPRPRARLHAHGPHLDEVALSLGGRALRRYGSQGEQRLALLALLFAERAALLDAGRPPPLMLLDDVMSELDPERRARLCERLAEGGGQALITATEPRQLPAACARIELAMRERQRRSPRAPGADAAARMSRRPRRARSAPRSARSRADAAPQTLLAAVQGAWPASPAPRSPPRPSRWPSATEW